MANVGETAEVWVTSRTTRRKVHRGTLLVQDLSDTVTHTMATDGPTGPNGVLTQYILASAERHLFEQLSSGLGKTADDEKAPLARLVPLETFGPDVLDISRNNLRRRWATSADWMSDVIAYALRPDRALTHAESAVSRAMSLLGEPLGTLIQTVLDGEIEAERDPARFRLAEIIRSVWPDHPAVRSSMSTIDEYVMTWWMPVYQTVLEYYGLKLITGVSLEDACWAFLTVTEQAGRSPDSATSEHAAATILLLISGGVVDAVTGDRLTPAQIDRRLPYSEAPSSDPVE